MSRPTIRKRGIPFTNAEAIRRHRAKKRAEARAEAQADREARRIDVAGPLGILPRSISDVSEGDLASGSVAAVITDPPYAEADVPLYGDLGRFAMRVLKPGGWCLAMSGDLYLDLILPLMTRAGLIYRSVITVTFPGGHHSRIASLKTFQAGKTTLMLQKPPLRQPPEWGPNVLAAVKDGHDKSLHVWQQSQPVFEKLVERFTVEGDLVADPFAGSGTTLRAALALRRRAWGCDNQSADRVASALQVGLPRHKGNAARCGTGGEVRRGTEQSESTPPSESTPFDGGCLARLAHLKQASA